MTQERMEQLMRDCTLCPRRCHTDRLAGQAGFCGQTAQVFAARAALHQWEEPCISGSRGSGTVFFSGCSLKCVYCQNHSIALGKSGRPVSAKRLAEIFLELQEKGAHNINLVTPTHFVPQICLALEQAKERGLALPVVYNTGGYESVDTLRMLDGLVDIYLPDFKYFAAELGASYSSAPDYFPAACAAVSEMFRQTGAFRLNGSGIMTSGVIVRHLILPGQTKDSKKIIRYLHETYGDDIYISIMSQYTPLSHVPAIPELNRRITDGEYRRVVDFAVRLGVTNAFVQEGEAALESFIPQFDGEGV